MLAECRSPEPVAFFRFRRQFGLETTAHVKHELWLLYPHLSRSCAGEESLEVLRDRLSGIEQRLAKLNREWSASRISTEWDAYRAEARTLLDSLEQQMRSEEEEIFPRIAVRSAA